MDQSTSDGANGSICPLCKAPVRDGASVCVECGNYIGIFKRLVLGGKEIAFFALIFTILGLNAGSVYSYFHPERSALFASAKWVNDWSVQITLTNVGGVSAVTEGKFVCQSPTSNSTVVTFSTEFPALIDAGETLRLDLQLIHTKPSLQNINNFVLKFLRPDDSLSLGRRAQLACQLQASDSAGTAQVNMASSILEVFYINRLSGRFVDSLVLEPSVGVAQWPERWLP